MVALFVFQELSPCVLTHIFVVRAGSGVRRMSARLDGAKSAIDWLNARGVEYTVIEQVSFTSFSGL